MMIMTIIKNLSIAIAFFALVALAVVSVVKLSCALPIEWGVPVGSLLFALVVWGVVEVLERSR